MRAVRGALVGVLFLCAYARAQQLPGPLLPTYNGSSDVPGSTSARIPVTMSGDTEVLGAEDSAATSRAAPLALEAPVDPDTYICGPGDVFELNFWGQQNFRLRIAADLEGRTFISKVGYVAVSGKTLTAVRGLIKQKVRAKYPGLQFELTLVAPRSFLVHVAGNVKNAGSYTSSPVERVSSVIARAGGVTGSRRRIEIKHRDGSTSTADLVLYELTGDTSYNPYLRDGDVVTAPVAEVVVTISGAVRRPGEYELVRTKDVAELLELAGGLKSSAARTLPVQVIRRDRDQRETFIDLPFSSSGALPAFTLGDDDRVIVQDASVFRRSVLLIGAVANSEQIDAAASSQRLPFVEGDTVRSLLERAGGIKAAGDLRRAYISRPRQGKPPLLIPLDLEALLVRRDFSADKPVHMNDTIVVPPMRYSVLVEGAVARPGLYNYNPLFSIPEYIALAGGRTRIAQDLDEVKLIDQDGNTHAFRPNMKPNPGDAILVPERNFSRPEVVQLIFAGAGLILSAAAVTIAATR